MAWRRRLDYYTEVAQHYPEGRLAGLRIARDAQAQAHARQEAEWAEVMARRREERVWVGIKWDGTRVAL